MIIKSSQRSGAAQLATHLTNGNDNEKVIFSDSRYLIADDVHGALDDMEDIARMSRCEKHLYHISINPSHPLDKKGWHKSWQLYEQEFGLQDNAFIEVTHHKNNRTHKHRVYERVTQKDDGTVKATQLSHTYPRNEKVARLIEYELSKKDRRKPTIGKHNKSVMTRLKAEGREDVVQWLENAKVLEQPRPSSMVNDADRQQEKRTGLSTKQVKADLTEAYENAKNGQVFETLINKKGYFLARGDRRDFVIVDKTGNVHSPRRRLGVKARELKEKWRDLTPHHLPTVEQAQQWITQQEDRKQDIENQQQAKQVQWDSTRKASWMPITRPSATS